MTKSFEKDIIKTYNLTIDSNISEIIDAILEACCCSIQFYDMKLLKKDVAEIVKIIVESEA